MSINRRDFFSRVSDGLHGAGLAYLMGRDLHASEAAPQLYNLKPEPAHLPAKAKSVIQLFMNGGPVRSICSIRSPHSKSTQVNLPAATWPARFGKCGKPAGSCPRHYKFTPAREVGHSRFGAAATPGKARR